MRVAIAGGGIAGLTAALALSARGFGVDVFERAAKLEEIGAGIQLAPNAMGVLQRLGVTIDGLCEPKALFIRDAASGRQLMQLALGDAARERHGAPYCTLHRADLQAGLLAAVERDPAIALRLSSEVGNVAASADAVTVGVSGAEQSFDLLVGADGVRSRVRAACFGGADARPLGHNAWRAVVPAASLADSVPTDSTGLWLGDGAHLVHYPVRGGTHLNVVVIGSDKLTAPPSEPFPRSLHRLIEATAENKPHQLMEYGNAHRWARGRVALAGDAAHAMAPSAAQGGAMAVEDAAVLAKCLAEAGGDTVAALAAYERLRRPRVARVAQTSRRNLFAYELPGAPAAVRNIFLSRLPARLFSLQLDWLFGWKSE